MWPRSSDDATAAAGKRADEGAPLTPPRTAASTAAGAPPPLERPLPPSAAAPLATSAAARAEDDRNALTGSTVAQAATALRAASEAGAGGSVLRNMLADAADPSHAMLTAGDLAEQNIGLQ